MENLRKISSVALTLEEFHGAGPDIWSLLTMLEAFE